ncbi:MAG: hypothetical protein ACK4UN_21410, partial [Limisphaerales bacterium]
MASKSTSNPEKRKQKKSRWKVGLLVALAVLVGLAVVVLLLDVDYAYMPGEDEVLNPQRINTEIAYDFWGRSITLEEGEELAKSPETARMLSPSHGAVVINDEFLKFGREAFYKETFGNE